MKRLLPVISVLMLALQAAAAPLDCIFEHYSSEDGLSHNYISQILQDRDGYIWISTWYGLSRFDGNRFVNYTVQPGDYSNLSHNRILSLNEDAGGHLWVTTYDNSIFRFDSDNGRFVAVPGDIDPALSKARVGKYHCDRAGNTWMALEGIGLYKTGPDLESELIFNEAPENVIGKEVREIFEDSDGNIYVVSETGLASVRDNGISIITRNPGISCFAETGNRLVFSSAEEIFVVDKVSGRRFHKPYDNPAAGGAVSMTVTGGGRCRRPLCRILGRHHSFGRHHRLFFPFPQRGYRTGQVYVPGSGGPVVDRDGQDGNHFLESRAAGIQTL